MAFEKVGFLEVNKELDSISQKIQELSAVLLDVREQYLTSKAKYDYEINKSFLENKAINDKMTQKQIEAMAVTTSYNYRMDAVKMESMYKGMLTEISALRDRQDALREISHNLRREATI